MCEDISELQEDVIRRDASTKSERGVVWENAFGPEVKFLFLYFIY